MARHHCMRHAAWIVSLALLSSCGSPTGLSDDELAQCLDLSNEHGSIGGSSQIISLAATLLPDDAIAPPGSTDDEIEATYDRVFSEHYGISVDEFLTLRQRADDTTIERIGEPPGVGELVGNEWFLERDEIMLDAWNDEHPQSARDYCELLTSAYSGEQ